MLVMITVSISCRPSCQGTSCQSRGEGRCSSESPRPPCNEFHPWQKKLINDIIDGHLHAAGVDFCPGGDELSQVMGAKDGGVSVG